MAEVLGIVTGVFQLISLCSAGFILIKDVVQAKQRLSEQLIRVQNHHDTRGHKFNQYAQEHPLSAKAVLRQLALCSRLFYDLKALERYGFKVDGMIPPHHRIQLVDDFHFEADADLSPQNIGRFEATCNSNLSVMKKIKFILGNRNKNVDELIIRSTVGVSRLDKGIYDNLGQVVADHLKILLNAYTREAEPSTDPRSAGKYRALAKMANFRSQVQEASGHPQVFGASSFHMADKYGVDRRGMSTMALLFDYPHKEWIQNPQLSGKKRDTERLALLLNVLKPDKMPLLDCYGILDDVQRTNRLGLVLKPPANVRANLPQPLRKLMETRDSLDLGARFDIARRIVDTIHMIHTVDWVHKFVCPTTPSHLTRLFRHIRSHSILFFSLGKIVGTSPNRPPYTVFDFSSPFIADFSNARSDDTPSGDYGFGQTKEANNLSLDYHQHPAKLNDPHVAYRRLFDLYSLGCVLLELALWTAVDMQIGHDPSSKEAPYKFIRALALKPTLDR
ncbi:hypothetical protein QBC36DRAFT_388330 [Triangularia setosa]|uniref:Protein kinase domain-containing protein n=1 Tax=Triangularia setosa TaxID=2587417 RepID=A0AAN6W4M0_9PEZI|nr:hypothetical protein QBC36DRAFT_388330 [Podospora setosa]